METHNKSGKPTRYGFACGYTETATGRGGNSARVYLEHGAYIVVRGPDSPAGRRLESCRTATEARAMARAMARGE